MENFKNFINNIDSLDLKIMNCGLKICFIVMLISVLTLSLYTYSIHNLFLYNIGLTFFRLSMYISVEFIVCGFVADFSIKQI